MKRAFLLFAILLCATRAFATPHDYYVSTMGVDTGSTCNVGSPCATFAYVAPLAVAGDDIIVRGGDYRSQGISLGGLMGECPSCVDGSNFTEHSGAITWKAYTGETVTVGHVEASRNYYVFTGINVDGQNGAVFSAAGVEFQTGHVIFQGVDNGHRVEIKNNTEQGCSTQPFGSADDAVTLRFARVHDNGNGDVRPFCTATGGTPPACQVPHHGCYWESSNGTIQDVEFDHNNQYGLQFYNGNNANHPSGNLVIRVSSHDNGGGWFMGSGAASNILENCLIYSNSGNGLDDAQGTSNAVYNCTIYGNGGTGLQLSTAASSLIKNNIVYGNSGSDITIFGDVTGAILTDNTAGACVVDATTGICIVGGGSGNTTFSGHQTGNPHLASPTADFGLTSSSTNSIANGVDLSATFTDDFFGATRASGAMDRGAVAYSLGGSCTPDHLTITVQPTNATLGDSISISIGIYDSGNVHCTSATNTVTLSKHSGQCTGMTLGGTPSGAATAGTFATTVTLTVATGACTLDAAASGLTGTTTSSFTLSNVLSSTLNPRMIRN